MNRPRARSGVILLVAAATVAGLVSLAGAARGYPAVWPSGLAAGETLTESGQLRSPSGEFSLTTAEGALTLTQNADVNATSGVAEVAWEVGATSDPPAQHRRMKLTMQRDGNLVLRDGRDDVLWQTHTAGTGHANRLGLSDRGNLRIRTADGKVVWSSHTTGIVLVPGRVLAGGHYLRYRPLHTHRPWTQLTMRRSGRLVLTVRGAVVWRTSTAVPGSYLRMARGGDLCVLAPSGRRLWHSDTGGHAGGYVVMADGAFRLFVVRRTGDPRLAFHAP